MPLTAINSDSQRSKRWTEEERGRLWHLRKVHSHLSWTQFYQLNFFPDRSKLALYTEYIDGENKHQKTTPGEKKNINPAKRPLVPAEINRDSRQAKQPRLEQDEQDEQSEQDEESDHSDGDIEEDGQTKPLQGYSLRPQEAQHGSQTLRPSAQVTRPLQGPTSPCQQQDKTLPDRQAAAQGSKNTTLPPAGAAEVMKQKLEPRPQQGASSASGAKHNPQSSAPTGRPKLQRVPPAAAPTSQLASTPGGQARPNPSTAATEAPIMTNLPLNSTPISATAHPPPSTEPSPTPLTFPPALTYHVQGILQVYRARSEKEAQLEARNDLLGKELQEAKDSLEKKIAAQSNEIRELQEENKELKKQLAAQNNEMKEAQASGREKYAALAKQLEEMRGENRKAREHCERLEALGEHKFSFADLLKLMAGNAGRLGS